MQSNISKGIFPWNLRCQGNIKLKLELQWRTFNWNLKVLLIKEAVFCIVHCLLLPLYLIEQFLRFQGAQVSNVSARGCLM